MLSHSSGSNCVAASQFRKTTTKPYLWSGLSSPIMTAVWHCIVLSILERTTGFADVILCLFSISRGLSFHSLTPQREVSPPFVDWAPKSCTKPSNLVCSLLEALDKQANTSNWPSTLPRLFKTPTKHKERERSGPRVTPAVFWSKDLQ